MRVRTAVPLLAVAFAGACGGGGDAAVKGATDADRTAAPAPATTRPPAKTTAASSHDWPTYGVTPARRNASNAPTGITASNARRLRRHVVRLPGTVDSSPIYLHAASVHGRRQPVVIVTTTYGRTLALTPGGRILWRYTPPGIRGWQGGYRITNATPVADAARRYVYTASPNGLIHKLRISNGREVTAGRWPVRITLLPQREKITSSLNLVGDRLLATTGGYIGDAPPYQGHIVTIDRRTGRRRGVWNSLCSDRRYLQRPSTCPESDSAIWSRSGPAVDVRRGELWVATGNARFDGRRYWGDSVLGLRLKGLTLRANWTPSNHEELNVNDTDLGSTSPALLPGYLGLQGGKEGKLFLIDLRRPNGTSHAGPRTNGQLQTLPTPGHEEMFTTPAVWVRKSGTLVVVTTSGYTAAYRLRGRRLHGAWFSRLGGSSPVIAGGLLYIYDIGGGKLRIRIPSTGRQVAALPAAGGHWQSPVIADRHVWLPEGDANDHATSGTLSVYSLP